MFNFIKTFKAKSKICCGVYNKNNFNLDNAMKYFDDALEIKPDCKLALYLKGTVYEIMHKYDKAFKCFDKAINIDQHYILPWIEKGNLLLILKKPDDAIKWFDKGLEKNRDDFFLLLNKTNAYIEKGDYESGLKCANYNLKIHPKRKRVFFIKQTFSD